MKETGSAFECNHGMYFLQKAIKRLLFETDCVFSLQQPSATAAPDPAQGTSMTDQPASGDSGNRAAVAIYVATLSADLATMARRSGLDTLGYLLEMVRLEAENVTRHKPNGGNG
jgi:hypothetical protein